MQAAHDVAELEYEIAEKNVEAVETRMKMVRQISTIWITLVANPAKS